MGRGASFHLKLSENDWEEDTCFTDKPDLVIENKCKNRIACEFSMVGLRELYKWKNDPKKQLDEDKLDSFIVPREPNIWLKKVIQNKNPKIEQYKKNSESSESWLIVHSVELSPYDVFKLDNKYDLPLLQDSANKTSHNFSRIYIVSANAGTVQVFPPDPKIGNAPLLRPGVLKQLEMRSMMKTIGRGETAFRIGEEFEPDRQQILKPLGDYSLFTTDWKQYYKPDLMKK